MQPPVAVSTVVHAPIATIWEYWTKPEHITRWYQASPDWHAPRAENNLSVGGTFLTRMEAKDGSVGFDFAGRYTHIIPCERIEYTIEDGRKVVITFRQEAGGWRLTEVFDPESENPVEMQRAGWQAILKSFSEYVQNHA